MYWVDRKAVRNVLLNPFNSKELIKEGVMEKIFSEINDRYHDEYDNKWTSTSIPLNYFAKEFVKTTGMVEKDIERAFIDYFEKGDNE